MNANAQFERDLERWLQAEAPATAPAGLHAAVIDRARTRRQRPGWATSGLARWFGRNRGLTLLAAGALLLVGGAMAAGSGLVRLPSLVPPVPAPSLAAVTDATASPTISPAPTETSVVASAGAASWAVTGSMVTPREGHTATLLPDGKVLVAGGRNTTSGNPNGTILGSAELYDASSGSWSATGSMSAARENHTATLLPDGKVLVVGGFAVTSDNPNGTTLATAELYDPATGIWSATGSMSTAREGHTATLLPDGKVLVVSGDTVTVRAVGGSTVTDPRPLASAELYDPASGTWTATGKMVYGGGTATLLPDGKVLVAGGSWSSGSFGGSGYGAATAELYDPASGTWTATGNMTAGRTASMATLLLAGKVLMACGCDHAGRASELYDPATGTWTATGTMAADHWRSTATMLPDGRVTATLLADGKVLVAGGGPTTLPAAELYDPDTWSWTATAKMLAVRVNHTATLLPDGKVLIAGGGDRAGLISSAELYDPGTGQ
jgi:WD40 repeat protein